MGTTAGGLPYPEDTDLESQGAQAIKALANALDTKLGKDTGWLNCTSLASGWTNVGPGLQARQVNGVVYLRGNVTNSAFTGGYTRVANMPAGVTPIGSTTMFPMGGNTTFFRAIQMTSDGQISFYTSGTTSAWYGVGSVIYPVG